MNHKHNMDCQQVLKHLNAFIDNELDSTEFREIQAHIGRCQNCQIVVNTLKKTIQLVQMDGQETHLPPEIRKRLYASLNMDDHGAREK